MLHQSNGPALIFDPAHQLWYLNNMKHRYYGPVSTWSQDWYIHGEFVKNTRFWY